MKANFACDLPPSHIPLPPLSIFAPFPFPSLTFLPFPFLSLPFRCPTCYYSPQKPNLSPYICLSEHLPPCPPHPLPQFGHNLTCKENRNEDSVSRLPVGF